MEPLRLSILIEWENVLLADLGRSRLMLQQLVEQIHELRTMAAGDDSTRAFLARFRDPIELLVLYNEEQIDGGAVRSVVTTLVAPDNPDIDLRFVPAHGLHYYDLKNYGATCARGDYILLLDSDVIPNRNWLVNLLGSFADPDVHVVGGDTCIDPDTLTSKAFALFWFFDLPVSEERLYRKHGFYANNVVFRRDVFLRFPFPPALEGVNRGSCVVLADILAEHGIPVHRNSTASVRHPAPNGFWHFVNRAVAQGRDRVFRRYPEPRALPFRHALIRLRDHLRSLSHVVRNRAVVNLSSWQLPLALGVATTYHLLQFFGEIGTRMNPDLMRRRFQI